MKKIICIVLVVLFLFLFVSCGKKKDVTPQIQKMKAICELATMKCYYHNVAKYYEKEAERFLWWTKDREFWIEYAGVVTIGIDASLLDLSIDDNNKVTITMPKVKVLGCKVDESTLTKDSFIIAAGSAKVEAEHQTAAFKEAQEKMLQAASEDTYLLANAQERVQKLLEDYVNNIGECVDKEYTIEWIIIESETNNSHVQEPDNNETASDIS